MATTYLTPNMNLLVPVVGAELAPTWASDLNVSLGTVDSHNHSSGQGVQINPDGLDINATLTFNSNAATALGIVGLTAQGTGVAVPVNDSIYVSGVDLYYQDGNGNAVRITSGGAVNATSSGIASGTATASFVSSVLVVDQSTGVGAPIDAATYILRYNGSYPSPIGNAIVLAAPSSLSGTYQVTLPATAPASNGSFLTENTSGVLSYSNVDGATLAWSAGVLSIATQGVSQGNLAPRSVTSTPSASGQIGLSASSGSFTSSSASFVTVTNLSVPIVCSGRPVIVALVPDGSTSVLHGMNVAASGNSAENRSAVFRGSTLVGQWFVFGTGSTPDPTSGGFITLDNPGAGTFTYTFQVYANVGTIFVNYASLLAYEL
jgi:hypothetical protein